MKLKSLVIAVLFALWPLMVWAGPRITTAPPPDSTFLHSDTVSWDQNVETLGATKTLVITDFVVQKLDPGGATRIVLLPTEATSTDLLFVIMNTANGAAENLQIKEDSGTTIIAEIGPEQMAIVHCSGTVWKSLTDSGFYYDGVGNVVSFGSTTPATSAELDITDINTGNGELHLRTYSTDADRYSRLRLRKSNANTETLTQTDDGDYLGIIQFEGANTTPGFAAGARIWARQTAAAGGQIPSYLSLAVSNDWTNFNRQLFLMDEGLVAINARDYTAEDPEATLHVYGGTWTPLTGTVTATNGSAILEGVTTTSFDTELVVGDVIRVESNVSAANPYEIFTITNIADSDTLTLDSNYQGSTDTLLRIYEDHANLFKLSDGDSKDRLIVTKAGTLHLGVDNVIGNLVIHDIGTITLYDDGDDTSVVLGPVGDGTTVLAITGSIGVTGNVAGATYGSDSSISDAELLTLDNGAVTQILVGGGAGSAPVWGTDIPTAVTIGAKYIYRADGTDVPVADGGTGAGTFTDGGLLIGSGVNAITAMAVGALGQVPVSQGTGDPVHEYQPKQNLLPNSGFGVWTNSTLTQGVGSGRQTDFNVAEILADDDGSSFASWVGADCTITDAGANLLITQTGAATQYARYPCAGLTPGKLYKISTVIANGTAAWGGADRLRVETTAGALIQDLPIAAPGTFSIIWECVGATDKINFTVTLGAGETHNITSIYIDEVQPGCVAADALGPDNWAKLNATDIWREHSGTTNTKGGSFYSLKILSSGGATYEVYYPLGVLQNDPNHLAKFAGRTVTLGAWVLTDAASQVKLLIYEDGNNFSSLNTGSAWEWLEMTHTFDTTPTYAIFGIYVVNTKTAYISQPMLVFGSSIGSGNYSSIPQEVIRFEKDIVLADYDMGAADITTDKDLEINVEIQSSGKIPKGIGELYTNIRAMDSAVGAGIGMWLGPDTTYTASGIGDVGLELNGLGNDVIGQAAGWARCTPTGNAWLFLNESGAGALNAEIRVQGVRLR